MLSSSNEGIQQQAAGALWSLSVNSENHIKVVREGALPYMVRLLQSGNPKIQEQAAGTLRNL
ncbi:MAG: armadillo/beta-catenin-like repeat-containing protein, partial [bacterium]